MLHTQTLDEHLLNEKGVFSTRLNSITQRAFTNWHSILEVRASERSTAMPPIPGHVPARNKNVTQMFATGYYVINTNIYVRKPRCPSPDRKDMLGLCLGLAVISIMEVGWRGGWVVVVNSNPHL